MAIIVIRLLGMNNFLLNFLERCGLWGGGEWGGVLLANSFHRFLGENSGGMHKISVSRSSPHGWNRMKKLLFCVVFIYLLFVYLLFVNLLFIYYLLLCSDLLGHTSVVWLSAVRKERGGRGGGCGVAISMTLCGNFGVLPLAYFVLLWVWCRMWWKVCLHF